MATKYIVNNVSGQTINGQPVIPPYKVFTALVTQSGGDNIITINSAPLTIGVTYTIVSSNGTDDFTNVGAPSNSVGVKFIATGTTPNSWTPGESELEYNTGAPVATVLENTIGNIWLIYNDGGSYSIKSTDLFTANKTFVINGTGCNIIGDFCLIKTSIYNTNTIDLVSGDIDSSVNDNELLNTSIEIRVYN